MAVLLEADARAAQGLTETAAALGIADRVRIVRCRVLDALGRGDASGPFDLIFADPPYALDDAVPFVAAASRVLRPGGLVIVERDADRGEPTAPGDLQRFRTATYGRAALDFYRHAGS